MILLFKQRTEDIVFVLGEFKIDMLNMEGI